MAANLVTDDSASHTQMAIVEAYEKVINYLYPILQNTPRKHGIGLSR